MRNAVRSAVFLSVVLATLISAQLRLPLATADNAPMWQSPIGLTPGLPGNRVRLVAEDVQVRVMEREAVAYALVDATFDLLNQGSATTMKVGFPTFANSVLTRGTDGSYSPVAFNPDLDKFRARVDGTEHAVALERVVTSQDDRFGNEWYVWEMAFPGGRQVRVQVSYEQRLAWRTDQRPAFAQVMYVLRTGALWHGTIGDATITMVAPAGGVFLGDPGVSVAYGEESPAFTIPPAGEVLGPDLAAEAAPTRIVWRLHEIEPDRDVGSLYVYAAPWQAVTDGEAALAAGSNDPGVYVRAARAALRLIGSVGDDDLPWGPNGAPKVILDRGYDTQARQWARRAITLAPGDAATWDVLGDVEFWFARPARRHLDELACWPTAAVDAYQRSQTLGSTTAATRLHSLDRARVFTIERGSLEPRPCPDPSGASERPVAGAKRVRPGS